MNGVYFLNNSDVIMFTLLSVHWADRIVATKSSKTFEKLRAIPMLPYSLFKILSNCPIFLFIC